MGDGHCLDPKYLCFLCDNQCEYGIEGANRRSIELCEVALYPGYCGDTAPYRNQSQQRCVDYEIFTCFLDRNYYGTLASNFIKSFPVEPSLANHSETVRKCICILCDSDALRRLLVDIHWRQVSNG